MMNILNWFRYNSIKTNPDKFQFTILGPSDDKCFILKINAIQIRNTSEVKLFGLTIVLHYDCIPHDLLIAILEAYGLHRISLNIF